MQSARGRRCKRIPLCHYQDGATPADPPVQQIATARPCCHSCCPAEHAGRAELANFCRQCECSSPPLRAMYVAAPSGWLSPSLPTQRCSCMPSSHILLIPPMPLPVFASHVCTVQADHSSLPAHVTSLRRLPLPLALTSALLSPTQQMHVTLLFMPPTPPTLPPRIHDAAAD